MTEPRTCKAGIGEKCNDEATCDVLDETGLTCVIPDGEADGKCDLAVPAPSVRVLQDNATVTFVVNEESFVSTGYVDDGTFTYDYALAPDVTEALVRVVAAMAAPGQVFKTQGVLERAQVGAQVD